VQESCQSIVAFRGLLIYRVGLYKLEDGACPRSHFESWDGQAYAIYFQIFYPISRQ